MNINSSSRYIPIVAALGVVVGIIIGTFFANRFSGNRLNIINTTSNKLNDLLHIIDDQYVDTVDIPAIVEQAMPKLLEELDPHSTYIGAKEAKTANDDLKGSFSGIGVQFTIRTDTVRITNVLCVRVLHLCSCLPSTARASRLWKVFTTPTLPCFAK